MILFVNWYLRVFVYEIEYLQKVMPNMYFMFYLSNKGNEFGQNVWMSSLEICKLTDKFGLTGPYSNLSLKKNQQNYRIKANNIFVLLMTFA